MRQKIFKWGERGDTIVEVLLSMVVLAIVAGTAYSTSQRNFQAGLNSQQRDVAAGFAQQQIELLKNADTTDTIHGTFESGTDFCIDPASPTTTSASCNLPFGASDTDANYKVTDHYDATKKLFTVKLIWLSGNRPQQTTVSYKPSQSFVDTPGGSCPTCVADIVTSPLSKNVNVSTDLTTVNYGGSVTIFWQTKNIVPGTCKAVSTDGTWSGSKPDNNPVGQNSGTLTNYTTGATFTLNCTGLDSKPVSGSVFVNVSPRPKPTITNCSNSVPTYNSVSLSCYVNPQGFSTIYQFSYKPNSSSSYVVAPASPVSIGGGTGDVLASIDLSGLASSTGYVYHLCATSTAGTTCTGDISFTTAAGAAKVISFSASNASYGGTSYLSWRSNSPVSVQCFIPGIGFLPNNYDNYPYGPMYGSGTFQIQCENEAGVWSDWYYAPVTTDSPPPPITVTFCYNASYDPPQGCYWGPFGNGAQCPNIDDCIGYWASGDPNHNISSMITNRDSIHVSLFWFPDYNTCGDFDAPNGYIGGWNDNVVGFKIGSYC
jgi:type II secretory pathway pseudopilin PulG